MSRDRIIRLLVFTFVIVGNIVAAYLLGIEPIVYYIIGSLFILGMTFWALEVLISKLQKRNEWLEQKLSQMNQITYQARGAGEISLNDFPFGILIFNDLFEIKWSNNYIKEVFGNSLIGRNIRDIDQSIITNIDESNSEFLVYYDNFTLQFQYNQEFSVLYITNITENVILQERYLNRRLSVGYLALDNLDETLANLDVQERTTIQGRYFSKVGEWAEKYDIYLKALSSEKFQLLMDYSQLQSIISDEFTILSDVRKISSETHQQIAASIGIVCWDENYVDLGERVNEALDIAFERGGDQAVVNIQGEPIKYYGGVAETVEKRSRVKARMVSGQILGLMTNASNIVVMSHISPDHDAFGAMIGVAKLAEYCGKEARMIIDKYDVDPSVEKILNNLLIDDPDLGKKLVSKDDARNFINDNTLMVVVDTNNPNIVYPKDFLSLNNKRVIIDHHRRGKETIEKAELIYTEPYASSSVELIVELMQFLDSDMNISSNEATLMYVGIVVDTNNFSYRTGSRTFDAASFLRLFGANLTKVKMYLREDYEEYMLQSKLLSEAEVYLDRFSVIHTDEVISRVSLAKLCDRSLMIDNVDASFVIGKISENETGITARSFGDVNVQIVMEKFNGGGHLHSAASQVSDSPKEVYSKLKEILDNMKESD